MMNSISLLLIVGLMVLPLSGCAEKEKSLGEEVQDVGENVRESVESAADEAQQLIGDAGEEAEDAIDEAGDKLEDAAEEIAVGSEGG